MRVSSQTEAARVYYPVASDPPTHSGTPAGLEEVFRDRSTPAEKLEAPSGALTYSQADLNQTVQRFTEYGVRILSPEEVAEQIPLYPKPLILSMPADLTTDQRV